MPSSAFFWDKIANHYAEQPIADEVSYQKKLKETQHLFTPESRVLEFGCGTGSTAICHAPYVSHLHATDISSNMLNIAKTKAEEARINTITFEQGSLMDLNISDGQWDVVLGMSILHLLTDWEAHIAKVYSLLKPGGVFVSSTACISDMNSWFKFVAPLFRLLPLLPNVQVFSQQALVQSMVKAGFTIEKEWLPGPDKAAFIIARKP